MNKEKKLREVIEITLSDETAIRRWVKKYTKFGLIALYEEDGRGRYTKLPKNQESKAKEEIQKMQDNRDGGRVIPITLNNYGFLTR